MTNTAAVAAGGIETGGMASVKAAGTINPGAGMGIADPSTTSMFREAGQASDALRAQYERNHASALKLGTALRSLGPRAVVTCARGSSDHAATFAKYLVETRTGLLASSAAPSVSSIYESKHDLDRVLFIAISQSGASPDLLATVAVRLVIEIAFFGGDITWGGEGGMRDEVIIGVLWGLTMSPLLHPAIAVRGGDKPKTSEEAPATNT
jgi:hypothetical protein